MLTFHHLETGRALAFTRKTLQCTWVGAGINIESSVPFSYSVRKWVERSLRGDAATTGVWIGESPDVFNFFSRTRHDSKRNDCPFYKGLGLYFAGFSSHSGRTKTMLRL